MTCIATPVPIGLLHPDQPVADILVKWDNYGWVAESIDTTGKSAHTCGPREAAEYLADAAFGRGNYTLKRQYKGRYIATKRKPPKEPLSVPSVPCVPSVPSPQEPA